MTLWNYYTTHLRISNHNRTRSILSIPDIGNREICMICKWEAKWLGIDVPNAWNHGEVPVCGKRNPKAELKTEMAIAFFWLVINNYPNGQKLIAGHLTKIEILVGCQTSITENVSRLATIDHIWSTIWKPSCQRLPETINWSMDNISLEMLKQQFFFQSLRCFQDSSKNPNEFESDQTIYFTS